MFYTKCTLHTSAVSLQLYVYVCDNSHHVMSSARHEITSTCSINILIDNINYVKFKGYTVVRISFQVSGSYKSTKETRLADCLPEPCSCSVL